MRVTLPLSLIFATSIIPLAIADQYGCPDYSIVYSPFRPNPNVSFFQFSGGPDDGCWWWAGCVFLQADECRKQQFGATSLVMGLVPLVLKDIAWPERRLVRIKTKLPRGVEILSRAMGIIPVVQLRETGSIKEPNILRLYEWTRKIGRGRQLILILVTMLVLMGCYIAIAFVEMFSKHSSLGCPYPIFVLTWHIVALLPAAINVLLAKNKPEESVEDDADLSENYGSAIPRMLDAEDQISTPFDAETPSTNITPSTFASPSSLLHRKRAFSAPVISAPRLRLSTTMTNRSNRSQTSVIHEPHHEASAIPGRGQSWWIQLVWAIYYTAGTLIYSSIMAVTVIELTVWILISGAVAMSSKLLAFFLCIYYEASN